MRTIIGHHRINHINSFCFIKIENSKINEINIKNNNFITNKKDKFMHGIGLKNIKDKCIPIFKE